MPLHKIEITNNKGGWALWHINESEDLLPGDEACPRDITNEIKRREWMAGRLLMKRLVEKTGLSYQGIDKDEYGKPHLRNHPYFISLSHSFPYVAAQLSLDDHVGIDIEQPKSKLFKIAPRVFSFSELKDAGDDLIKNYIYWCAKEALYKIFGKGGLSFIEHLRVEPFELKSNGELVGLISMNDQALKYKLIYEVNAEFVLVRTK